MGSEISTRRTYTQRLGGLLLTLLVLFGGGIGSAGAAAFDSGASTVPSRFIIQGRDLPAAKAAVRGAGAEVTQELKIIRAVVASLSSDQLEQVENSAGVHRVWADVQAEVGVPRLPLQGDPNIR